MRMMMILGLALLSAAIPALASGYDYMRGDDIYQKPYDYGLHYNELRSEPDSSPSASSDAQPDMPSLKPHADSPLSASQDRFPTMDSTLRRFHQQLYGTPPALEAPGIAPATPGDGMSDLDKLKKLQSELGVPER